MGNKYGEALGVWELTIGRSKSMGPLELHPTHRDNRKFLSIVTDDGLKNNQILLMEKVGDFVKGLIMKEYPPVNDNEKEDLEDYIGCNLLELMKETMIAFKVLKREDLEKQESLVKKGLLQVG